jgi:hypothetical protein
MDDLDIVNDIANGACFRRDYYFILNPDIPQRPEMSIAMSRDTYVPELSWQRRFFDVPGSFFENSVIRAFKHNNRHLEARNLQFCD